MKSRHSWFTLIGFCILTVFAAALGFAVRLTSASVALADRDGAEASTNPSEAAPAQTTSTGDTQIFNGFVTDELCGARHDMGSGKSAAECTQRCAKNGARYALIDGDKKFTLTDNTNQLASVAGQRVTISGRIDGDQIQVDAVRSAP